MDVETAGERRWLSRGPSHPRFLLFLAVFAIATGLLSLRMALEEAVIFGFDLAAAIFTVAIWPLWRSDRVEAIRSRSSRDDGGRVLLPAVAALLLAAVLLALVRLVGARQDLTGVDFAAVAATLALAWLFANLVFALHYAHVFYEPIDGGDRGGLDFPGDEPPLYADFVYFAFVVGMTCQTADVAVTSRRMRRIATAQGLLAFVFNLGVLAMTINVLAGVL